MTSHNGQDWPNERNSLRSVFELLDKLMHRAVAEKSMDDAPVTSEGTLVSDRTDTTLFPRDGNDDKPSDRANNVADRVELLEPRLESRNAPMVRPACSSLRVPAAPCSP